MKVSTNELVTALSLLGNGISKKSTARIETKMVELSVEDGVLYGYTSDGINYIKTKISDTTEDILAVVDYNMLNNLVKATSSETISIKADAKVVSIKATDLSCKLPILIDSMGNIVKISKFWSTVTIPKTYNTVDFSSLNEYIPTLKNVIKEDFVIPCYSCVFFNKDYIMASDTDNLIRIDVSYFDSDILLTLNTTEFLAKLGEVDTCVTDDMLFVHTDTLDFISRLQDKSEYQNEDLNGLIEVSQPYNVNISGEKLATALNMSKLFGFNVVQLVFGSDGVFFKVPQQDFNYKLSDEAKADFTYNLNNDVISKMLLSKKDFTLNYGEANMVMVTVDNTYGVFSFE